MNCHGENALQPINKSMYWMNSCRISGHFDTKLTTIAQIEQILQEFKDPEIGNILNLERVYFLVTRVKCQSNIIWGQIEGTYFCTQDLYQLEDYTCIHSF